VTIDLGFELSHSIVEGALAPVDITPPGHMSIRTSTLRIQDA